MKLLDSILERIRKKSSQEGFTCDGCGGELFDYPKTRFCLSCKEKLLLNNGRFCEKCGRKTVAEGVCLSCKAHKPKFTKAYSPFVYDGLVCSLINRFKNGERYLAYYFGEKMTEKLFSSEFQNEHTMSALKEEFTKNNPPMSEMNGKESVLIIPVPMTKKDERERGFNQATELAKVIKTQMEEREIAVELDEEVLLKVKQTPPQKQRAFFEREENLKGAFHVHKRKACKDRRILLVDDIMTTGATASLCASHLISSGAREVIFLSIASLAEQK